MTVCGRVCVSVAQQTKESELERMRHFYEEKLSEMKARVAALEAERESIIGDLHSTSTSPMGTPVPAPDPKAQEALTRRLQETEKQLADMKSKQRDLERIAEIKSKMASEARTRARPPVAVQFSSLGCVCMYVCV